jgi:pyruvate dehydrogenase E1 component
MCSWIAAATSYSTSDEPMIPIYIFYSMFGFQRIGDLMWAAGDMRSRGFLMGGTAGRTTLNGEGLQHEDGQSQIMRRSFRTAFRTIRRTRTNSRS